MHETALPGPGDRPLADRVQTTSYSDDAPGRSEAPERREIRVTQLDIARAAGVHNTTVSLALRNNPVIPLATRERIQTLARTLGYRPDPALQALANYRKSRSTTHRAEPLAYLTSAETRWGWRKTKAEELYFIGAKRRALERGYELEPFWLGEPGMNPRRMGQVLFNRGISGVVLAPATGADMNALDLSWDLFSTVRIGGVQTGGPALNSVTNDCEGSLRLAVQEVLTAGFRRIGLLLPSELDCASNRVWSLGFMTEQVRTELSPRIPVCQVDSYESALMTPEKTEALVKVASWFAEYEPEVVLGFRPHSLAMLSALSLVIPSDVAFVDLSCESEDPAVAGVRQSCEETGAMAVDLLASQLQQNQRGVPKLATITFVSGSWQDGASLPKTTKPVLAAS